MNAPQRLRDDPAIAPELKQALQTCALDDAYDVDAGLSRFEQTLRADATPSAAHVTRVAGSASRRIPWLWIGGLTLGALLAAWWWARSDRAASTTPHAPAPTTHAAPIAQPAPSLPAPATIDAHAAEPVPERAALAASPTPTPTSTRARTQAARTTTSSKPETAATDTVTAARPTEVELIAQARRALTSDPAQVLRLTRQLEQELPNGMLREERDGLSVIALWNLGQRQAAQARAEQFIQRHPRSAIRPRIQSILDGTHK